jgi:membrane-bound lytic murein transglycosylase D
VAHCLAQRPPEERVTFRKHVVRRGQTLGSIARANGVTARDVAEANGITLQKRLRVGAELIVPVPAGPRVTRVRREIPAAAGARDRGDRVLHRIRPGDTLTAIAARYGTTVRELQDWNGLGGSAITAGGVLEIEMGASRD